MIWSTLQAAAFSITVVVEALVASALPWSRRRTLRDGAPLNALTHPVAWTIASFVPGSWLALELSVVAVEAAGYRIVSGLDWRRALVTSALCNGVTMTIGALA